MDIEVKKGDITQLKVGAVVNAANKTLMGGGGVDGAIHNAGGPEILEECKAIRKKQGQCPTGKAVITTAGKMPANYIIHTVGPVWNDGNNQEPELLANCYKNSLKLADDYNIKTIAFPNISTGVYGYPKQKAAEIAVKTIKGAESSVEKVIFVCFDEENYNLYKNLLG